MKKGLLKINFMNPLKRTARIIQKIEDQSHFELYNSEQAIFTPANPTAQSKRSYNFQPSNPLITIDGLT